MLTQIFSVCIIASITFVYFVFVKPIKIIKRLIKQFESQGYKVYTFPYNPLRMPGFQIILNDSKTGDPYKTYATKFVEYDLIVANKLTNPSILLLSPRARKQLVKHQIDYAYQKVPFFVNLFSRMLGRGLLFSEENQWKRKRRIMSTFFTFQFLQSKIPEILQIIESSLDEFQMKSKSNKNNQDLKQNEYRFKLIDVTTRMFSNVILSIFLGTQSLDEEIDGQKVHQFILKLVTESTVRSLETAALVLGPKFLNLGLTSVDRDIKRRVKLYDDWANKYVDKLIQKASNTEKPTNLLQLLYKSKSTDSTKNYTKEELIQEFKIFFFAGTDTTSHFLEMMIYLSVKNKETYSKARSEIEEFKQNINNNDALKKLKYIEAIQKQTIRFYGPILLNFARIAVKQHLYDGVFVPKGTIIQYYSICTHYNPEYYPQPFSFNPDRWQDTEREIDAACLTGFGMGPRSCIGQNLALTQSKMAYYTFLKRYNEIKVPQKVDLRFKFMNQAQDLDIVVKKRV